MREDIVAASALVRVADARASTAEVCAAARIGDAYNNAMAESFFSTPESELLARRRFHSQAEAQMACFTYIERFYTPLRRHSALKDRSPVVYEQEIPDEMQMMARLSDEFAVLMPCGRAVTARRSA